MTSTDDYSGLVSLAQSILDNATRLDAHLRETSIKKPSLEVGASTELWSLHSGEVENARNNIIGFSKQLNKLLTGPHGFLHDLISPNWELGALYTVLEFDILEMIPLDGELQLSDIATRSGLPEDKLLTILRLIACEHILQERPEKVFRHTAISEELVHDANYKAFLGFESVATPLQLRRLTDEDSPGCSRLESQAPIWPTL